MLFVFVFSLTAGQFLGMAALDISLFQIVRLLVDAPSLRSLDLFQCPFAGTPKDYFSGALHPSLVEVSLP